MTDRTVSVIIQARITDYMTKMSAASKATTDFANKVDVAKGRAAQGYHAIGVAGVAMGAVVAGGFALAIKSAADFDSKMALVRTLSHATAGDMGQLRDAALHVGQAYGFTANEVADAEAELVKAGVSVADIMGGALTGALTLASAGQTDVATATTIAATAMTQFALSGKDVPHIADLLAAGADKALGSVVDLGYALDTAGPTAHQFGISLEETVGTLAAFAQSGQIGERGGTIFQQMLLKLTAPGKQATDILKQLGISIYGTNGQFVGMSSLAGQLQTKLSGLTQAERNHDLAVIFGARAIRGANILYQEGAKGIEDWTKRVNDQGFAALQAAGKLDSLSGDLTKLKAALQTAFIGAGEGGQGPLRTMVQDVTKAVEVWNELPAPVRASAEALTAVAGAVALAGGAALLFIPKWAAMNAALKETSIGAISARGALGGLGRIGFVGGVLATVAAGITAVDNALRHPPNADKLTESLLQLANGGQATGELSSTFGRNLQYLGQEINRLADPSVLNRIGDVSHSIITFGQGSESGLSQARDDVHALDNSLAGLVQSGHAEIAAAAFQRLAAAAKAQGIPLDRLAHVLPQYGKALTASKTSAELAGNGVDQFGNKVAGAAKKTISATDAAKKYSDQLHALGDPLFAMNQALQGVTDAQDAATKATHKYGADSPQARQANLDLASSALDAEAAARTLAASVKNGSVSIGDARKFLHAWVADGLLTKQQADNVSGSFDHLIGRAETISGLHPHVTVTADTSQAETALSNLLVHIGQVINGFLSLGGASGINPAGGVGTQPYGPVADKTPKASGGKSPTAGYTPTTSDAGYYTPSSTGKGSGSSSSKQRPPTVQEIVHAILTGTIPPSIDQLRRSLQIEIRHLSTVVGSAEQYRSSVRSGLLGYASLSNNTGMTDSLGSPMSVSVNSYLKSRYADLKLFVHLRERLVHDGAKEGLLEEIDSIGPTANPMMRQLLAQGRHGVAKANRLEGRIHHLASREAGIATSDKYGSQIVSLLQHLPHKEAHLIEKALAKQHIDVSLKHVARHRGRRVRNKS